MTGKEVPKCKLCKATVMFYDEQGKKWVRAGTQKGVSNVCVYGNDDKMQFRIVGRKEIDQEVVINCAIQPTLKYNAATATFHQWRESNMKVVRLTSRLKCRGYSKSRRGNVSRRESDRRESD